MTPWVEQIERRARMIHDEIAVWRIRARELGLDPDQASQSFYDLLSTIYGDDMPLAQAKDNSDLLLHIEGPAVERTPRISLVSGLFNNVKFQVRDLTKAIAGILPDRRVTVNEIDLGLSGIAKGSLFIGFNVPLPEGVDGQVNLLGDQDPLYRATKDALRVINTVSHTIDTTDEVEASYQVAQAVNDPKVRDAALVAVRRIAPSGRQGVSQIAVTGTSGESVPANLTPQSRLQIGHMLKRPVTSQEVMEFEGQVREIDLDAKRFDLRGINDHKVQDIRCVYSDVEGILPRALLDARIRVRGRVERRADEVPRLIAVQSIEVLRSADEQRSPIQ